MRKRVTKPPSLQSSDWRYNCLSSFDREIKKEIELFQSIQSIEGRETVKNDRKNEQFLGNPTETPIQRRREVKAFLKAI
jgi:hypothetical protein